MPTASRDLQPNPLTELIDADLVRLAAEGEPCALEVLYDRYNRVVYSFALRILGDPRLAEELLQEVFFRVWRQGNAYQSAKGSFITWLLSITHNMAIDDIRKRKRRPQSADNADADLVLAGIADNKTDVENEVWLGTVRSSILAAMETLPPAQRDAIELAYFQGLTQREVADRLGEPLGTIKTRMRLGMQKLRDQLGDQLGNGLEPDKGKLG